MTCGRMVKKKRSRVKKMRPTVDISALLLYSLLSGTSLSAPTIQIRQSNAHPAYPLEDDYFVTETVGPVDFDGQWIRAGKKRNQVVPIWYRMHGDVFADMYIPATYNITSKTVQVSGSPCGYVPSLGCLFEMFRLGIQARSSDRCESPIRNESRKIRNPFLYNLPRWSINVRLLDTNVLNTDVVTVAYLALSALTAASLRHNRTCTDTLIHLTAVQLNILNVTVNRTSARRAASQLYPQTDLKYAATVNTSSASTLTLPQFVDYTILMYNDLYSGIDCRFRSDTERDLIFNTKTIHTHAGNLNVSSLFTDEEPVARNETEITIGEIAHTTPLLRDYLEGLALKHALDHHIYTRNFTSVDRPRHSQSISLRSI